MSVATLQGCELSPAHLPASWGGGVDPLLQDLPCVWNHCSDTRPDSVAHVSGFCPDRYSYDAQDHYQRQRILQKERAIVSDGGLGI